MTENLPTRIYHLECSSCGFKRALEVTVATEGDILHSNAIYCPHCHEVMPMVASENPNIVEEEPTPFIIYVITGIVVVIIMAVLHHFFP